MGKDSRVRPSTTSLLREARSSPPRPLVMPRPPRLPLKPPPRRRLRKRPKRRPKKRRRPWTWATCSDTERVSLTTRDVLSVQDEGTSRQSVHHDSLSGDHACVRLPRGLLSVYFQLYWLKYNTT